MKAGIVLLVLAIGVGAIGYLELKRQAEREGWRADMSLLSGRLERAERRAEERAQAAANIERDRRASKVAADKLADLEARILDRAAELARLESDRVVAKARAVTAIEDLKQQVRALTTIEIDMATLDRRRHRLEDHVDTVEERLQQAEAGAAERQKRAEALDRDIANLAIRRETVQAGLNSVERTTAKAALDAVTEQSIPASASSKEPKAVSASVQASLPAAPEEGDRTRGLYQFSSLRAAPELDAAAGKGGLPPSTEDGSDGGNEESGEDWAEDQYLLGLSLLSSAEHSSGTVELSDAVLAFKAVLGEWPKQRDPMRFAIARSDLGYALALLGKRQGKIDLLEEAAAACREALSAFKREQTPLLWAAAQHHLGVSLGGLADMQDDQGFRKASIEALEQAIDAFKDAGAETDAKKAEDRLREAYADLPATADKAASER